MNADQDVTLVALDYPWLGEKGPEMVANCPNCGKPLTPTVYCLSCGHQTEVQS